MNWVEAGSGYQLALQEDQLVCRNTKGKQLSVLPKAARDSAAAEQLLALRDWLKVHRSECVASVERWILRSLPVPLAVLESIWPDPTWSQLLANLVAVPLEGGQPDWHQIGILGGVSERGLGLVDQEGESRWTRPESVMLPHPILIQDLNDFRELLTELQLTQSTSQLFRECWPLPDQPVASVSEFSGGKFQQIIHAHGRCRNLGYPVRGGFATSAVWRAGQQFEARYWVGAGSPDEEVLTGDLVWVDTKEVGVSAQQAGPVAYSEGMRMASQIYAGRVVEKPEA